MKKFLLVGASLLALSIGASAQIVSNGASGSGSGSVTSVALSSPSNAACVVSGSPVTTSGTLVCTPTGTSGGIPYFSGATALSSSSALTANLPVIGGGAGVAPTVGSRSGNTTTFATTTGSLTNGHAAAFDASGNIVDSGGAPGTGTVSSIAQGNGILLSTAPCTTTCTISTTVANNAQTGTTYATLTTDGGKVVSLSNASPVAVSLSQANTTGFTAGFGLDYDNIGAGLTTITAATSVFDNGLTTLNVATGQDAYVWSDGTNYHSVMSLPVMAQDTLLGNPAASNYPVAMTLPSCANDGAHALVYASHALACASISGGSGSPGGSDTQIQFNNSSAFGGISTFTNIGGALTLSTNGAASTPAFLMSGQPFSGTGTTSMPLLALNDASATAETDYSTGGTFFGANGRSGFGGYFANFAVNGSRIVGIRASGEIDAVSLSLTGSVTAGNSTTVTFGTQGSLGMTSASLRINSDTATPLAQYTYRAANGVGTNIAGAAATTFQGSLGTGNAASGAVNIDVGGAVAGSGTTLATPIHGMTITGVTGAVAFPQVTTGTNADFVCMAAGNVLTLQSSACTISSLRYKENVADFSTAIIPTLASLSVDTFKYKNQNKDPNGNTNQLGLIAEDVAKKLPICAEYESDMKTPKSYKQECVIAALVKGMQEQQAEISDLKKQIAHK